MKMFIAVIFIKMQSEKNKYIPLQQIGECKYINVLSSDTPTHWRRKWQPTPVFLPGESHALRNLTGYNPWGHKESDTTD